MRESGFAHIGLAYVIGEIGDFADAEAQGPQAAELFVGNNPMTELELKIGDDPLQPGQAAGVLLRPEEYLPFKVGAVELFPRYML